MAGLLVNSLGRTKHVHLYSTKLVINMVMAVFRKKAAPVRNITTIVMIKINLFLLFMFLQFYVTVSIACEEH